MTFITKKKTYTYLDRVGTTWIIATKKSDPRCERVVFTRWHDTQELTIRHCKGDGRRFDFQVFHEDTLPAIVEDDVALAMAKELLKNSVNA